MLHEQNTFLTILTPLLPRQHSLHHLIFLGLAISLSRGIPLGLHHTLKSSSFRYLVHSFGSRFFQHTFPFTALERRIKVAFFPGGRVLGGILHIPLSPFFIVEAYSMALWDHCERFYRYTNLRVGETVDGSGSA